MSKSEVTVTEAESTRLDWVTVHRQTYLRSGGREGHIVDLTEIGGRAFTTTLLLQTIGRKTGQKRTLPLIYGGTGGEVVVVASKGGADIHPAWYLNLSAGEEVCFQIATQAFRASWREPQGIERSETWAFMENLFPPYKDYQAGTDREIPLVMMSVMEPIDVFRDEGA